MNNYCYHCMNELADGQNVCPYCHKENTPENIVYRLRPGTILDGKYLVGESLGEGGFGITYIGRDLSLDIKVAIKEYYPNGYVNRNNTVTQDVNATTENQKHIFYKGKDSFLDEARKIAKFLGEPGIVGVREYFEENGTAYIIMEYLDGENLAAYIKKNGTFEAQKIFRLMLPITHSLKRIHDAGMIHRDISPDNIMYMRNGSLKLMDFGSARYFTNEQKEMSVLLKQGYAPEEQYRKNGKQGPWTDVYGLCATMYRCITGSIPEDALDRLRDDNLVPPSKMGINISPALENILLYGLAVFKENRCQNMEELSSLIEQALDDPKSAAQKTAALLQKHQPTPEQAEQRTYLADDESSAGSGNAYPSQPITGNQTPLRTGGNTNQPGYATPVRQNGNTNNPGYATPVRQNGNTNNPGYVTPVQKNGNTNNPGYATSVQKNSNTHNPGYATPGSASRPLQNTGYSAASSSMTPNGVQTAVAKKPKKKKTGLIIGLILGGVAVVVLALIVVLALNSGGSLDGRYRLIESVSSGKDHISEYKNDIYLNVKDNVGTIDTNGKHMEWRFDTETHKITTEDNETLPYRVEGKKLILEDDSGRMTFEKQ